MTAWVERVTVEGRGRLTVARVYGGRRARGLVGVSRGARQPTAAQLADAQRRCGRSMRDLDEVQVAFLLDALADLDRQFAKRLEAQAERRKAAERREAIVRGEIAPSLALHGGLEAVTATVVSLDLYFRADHRPASAADTELVAARVESATIDRLIREGSTVNGVRFDPPAREMVVGAVADILRQVDAELARRRERLDAPPVVEAWQAGGQLTLLLAGLCGMLGPVDMRRVIDAVKTAARDVRMPARLGGVRTSMTDRLDSLQSKVFARIGQ